MIYCQAILGFGINGKARLKGSDPDESGTFTVSCRGFFILVTHSCALQRPYKGLPVQTIPGKWSCAVSGIIHDCDDNGFMCEFLPKGSKVAEKRTIISLTLVNSVCFFYNICGFLKIVWFQDFKPTEESDHEEKIDVEKSSSFGFNLKVCLKLNGFCFKA